MNRFIMADAEKCIGCRTCEVACAVAHQDDFTAQAFTSRLRVVKGDAYTTAVGCHQCEDAPCANVCPTHAISRTAGVWLVEQTRCNWVQKLYGGVSVRGDAGAPGGK